jgi:hypothetical protein
MATEHIWSQPDRETPMQRARRDVITAVGAVESMRALFEDALASLYRPSETTLYARALQPLSAQISRALTLLEAYDYYLARCAEAGLTPAHAQAAWEAQSSAAWEAALVEGESHAPNALAMVDTQSLVALGLPPHEDPSVTNNA